MTRTSCSVPLSRSSTSAGGAELLLGFLDGPRDLLGRADAGLIDVRHVDEHLRHALDHA